MKQTLLGMALFTALITGCAKETPYKGPDEFGIDNSWHEPEAEALGIGYDDANELLSHYVPNAFALQVLSTGVKDRVKILFTDRHDLFTAVVDESTYRVFEIRRGSNTVYKWPGIRMIAHRGAGRFAPENTVPSTLKAIELGAEIIELDVRETKDGELVIMHDGSVNRTTNGSGDVRDLTFDEIRRLDAGSHFGAEFAGVQVPTFREILQAMKGLAAPDVDYKAGDRRKLDRILREEGFLEGNPVTFYDSSSDVLNEMRSMDASYWLRASSLLGSLTLGNVIKKSNPHIIYAGETQHTKSYFRKIHKLGKKSIAGVIWFNAFEKSRLEKAVNLHADFVMTDNLPLLNQIAQEKGLRNGRKPL